MGFFRDIAEEVGKWIPNEISKTNSFSKYTQYIPVVGPFVSGGQRALSAVDNAATAYGDTGDIGTAIRGGPMGVMGQSASPGDARTGFYNTSGRNFFDIAGQIGNYLPGFSTDAGGSVNGFDLSSLQGSQKIFSNPTLFQRKRPQQMYDPSRPPYLSQPVYGQGQTTYAPSYRVGTPPIIPEQRPFSLYQAPGQFR